jgi:NADH dehydrogenase FAD-containing subunit
MANGMPIPKAGVFAASQGETVACNIAAEITGGKKTEFPGEGYCFLSASGEAAGVVEGSFLADEKPDVTFRGPSKPGMKRKEQFEADWRAFRI